MQRSIVHDEAVDRRAARPAAAAGRHGAGLLRLQASAGNRATTAAVQRAGDEPADTTFLPSGLVSNPTWSEANNNASTSPLTALGVDGVLASTNRLAPAVSFANNVLGPINVVGGANDVATGARRTYQQARSGQTEAALQSGADTTVAAASTLGATLGTLATATGGASPVGTALGVGATGYALGQQYVAPALEMAGALDNESGRTSDGRRRGLSSNERITHLPSVRARMTVPARSLALYGRTALEWQVIGEVRGAIAMGVRALGSNPPLMAMVVVRLRDRTVSITQDDVGQLEHFYSLVERGNVSEGFEDDVRAPVRGGDPNHGRTAAAESRGVHRDDPVFADSLLSRLTSPGARSIHRMVAHPDPDALQAWGPRYLPMIADAVRAAQADASIVSVQVTVRIAGAGYAVLLSEVDTLLRLVELARAHRLDNGSATTTMSDGRRL